jgi:hypothetical protein
VSVALSQHIKQRKFLTWLLQYLTFRHQFRNTFPKSDSTDVYSATRFGTRPSTLCAHVLQQCRVLRIPGYLYNRKRTRKEKHHAKIQ